ncbi:3-deoxy-D-manno-octulosonic acid transferase [Parapedobacter tibetensis]|uniref:3-deoxy-D-manno-octulosonic acid transferase n=1 Tax=Parapedobacter tibetensis TaxID=2972951 RepID=UPI00214D3FF0|nr:glycosyltransferase N-terminal domain-containing protein [Parapedobacter tibetensis]
MWIIYLIGVKIYGLIIWVLSPFYDKAKKWTHGRRGLFKRIAHEVDSREGSVWFHFASLGEFEQGRPVLEGLRALRPNKTFVITFYSPSGYEIRKDMPLADHVYYLPEDTPGNAAMFVRLINPELVVFTKYEYWPFFFRALASNNIPLYLISAIFRPNQVFFKWYGSFFRQTLGYVTHFFTQNEESLTLLTHLGHTNASLAGDTRFDRVVALPKTCKLIPEVEDFVQENRVLVAGSTWPADEELLAQLHRKYPTWKIIIAPHEIHEDHLRSIEKLFPESLRFSVLSLEQEVRKSKIVRLKSKILIIDNIGMLSLLYTYGHVAYIGGGFGTGIHNTLEAATYGIPVIFGPNYHKFQEANDLIANGGGFSVRDEGELLVVFESLQTSTTREATGKVAERYVQENAGATRLILNHLVASDTMNN